MAKVRDTVVRIRGQETVSDASQKARKSLGALDKETQRSTKAGLASFKGLATKAGIYGAAIAGVVLGVKNLISAYAEQEAAERGLAAAARNNPYLDPMAVERLKDFASELQGVSVMGDEVALGFAKIAAASGRTEGEIEGLLQATVDTAAALDVSLDTAFQQLNKTFGGTAGELGELIPALKNLTSEQLAAGEAVDIARKQFSGMAEEFRDTTQGEMMSFANAWGDLKEQLGGFADTVVSPIIQGLTSMVEAFNNATGAISDFIQRREDMKALEEGTASGNQARRALEAQLSQITEEIAQREQELSVARQEVAAALVGMGIERGTAQFRQAMEEEIAPYEAALEQAIRSQSNTAQRINALVEDATAAGATDGKRQLSEDEQRIEDTVASIRESFEQLEQQAEVPGREMDLFAEKQKVLNGAIDDLISDNFTVSGGGLQHIFTLFGEYLREAGDATLEYTTALTAADRAMAGYRQGGGTGGAPAPYRPGITSGDIAMAGFAQGGGMGGGAPTGGGGLGVLNTFLSFIDDAAGEFVGMIASVAEVQAVLDPVTTILKAALEVISNALSDALEPLVTILTTLGQTLGTLLLPYLEIFGRMTRELGKAFKWFYNSVIRPVGNFFISAFEMVGNFFIKIIRGVINALNKIPGVNINKPKKLSFDRLEKLEDLTDEDTEPTTGGSTGSPVYGGSTTVRQPPDIYIYQYFRGPVVGAGGMEAVGEYVVGAIQSYAGVGGDVTFEEAG